MLELGVIEPSCSPYKKRSTHANVDYFSRQRDKGAETEERTAHSSGECVKERELLSHPSPSYNAPPLEGDWARRPNCGTVCAIRSTPLREMTDRKRFGPAPV